MSDLSRLLDDVYGDPAPAAQLPPEPSPAPLVGLPDWAVESVLDEAFADWVPGPAVVPPSDAAEAGPPSDDAVTGPTSVPRSAFTELAEEPAPAPEVPHGWCRDDDDILPSGRRGSRRSRQGRGQAPVAPPAPIEAFASQDAPAPAEAKPSRFRRRNG